MALPSLADEVAPFKRVLILHSFGRDFAPFSAASSVFRTELAKQSKTPLEFLDASLETARYSEGAADTPFVAYPNALFADRPPDLLVPFAELAVRILEGEPAGNIAPVLLGSGSHLYDSRELKRWDISESRLPAGSVVRFREPTSWERYRFQVLGAVGLITLQAGLIFLLLVERKQRRSAQRNVDDRLRFEELVSGLSAKFVHLDAGRIDERIVDSLREIAQFLGFDFSTLSIFTGPAVGRVAFIWQAPGTPAMPSNLTEKDFPWMARELFAGRHVSILQPGELPEDAQVDRATIERIHNKSVHCVPLSAGETPVGVLNVGTFAREQGIAPDLMQRLRLLGEIFANALARKRSYELLRESEERFGLAAQSANLGVWSWDLAKNSIWATEGCRAIYGMSADQPLSFDSFFQTLHEDDRERVRRSVDDALRYGTKFGEQYRVVLADGLVRWIETIGRGHYDKGEPRRMLGVSIDISARKQAEEDLQRERAFLRQVIDIDPNFIFAKDRAGSFTLANRAVADAYGTTVENLLGKTDADFNPNAEEVEFFHRMDLDVIDTLRERFIPEEHITDAHGKVRWLQTVKRPIVEPDGSASQVLGASTDITARRAAEAELQRNRDQLAHMTRVATLGELVASLAHELNQPLGAILSNADAAEMLLMSEPPALEEVREILADIRNDDRRASEVIRGLRGLTRKEEIKREPLQINEALGEVVRLVSIDAAYRRIAVRFDPGKNLPLVLGDRVQLQQVTLNLVVNAMDAIAEFANGRREVVIRSQATADGMIQVAVSDSGRGIPSERLSRLFEPFYTTKQNGMGMGLSIARSIVEAHQGRLWAASQPDDGANFYFTVPVARPA